MAVLTIQFLSCSKSDDEKVLQQQNPVMSRSLSGDTEGQMFYKENSSDIIMVSILGTFSTIDQDDKVEVYNNLGGSVQTKDGGSFTVTSKGKGLHIVGSGITHPQSGFTYNTTLSLDIDDASLIESCKATITNIELSMDTEISWYGTYSTGSAHLSASDIPMVDSLPFTHWKGGTITDYSYATDGLSMSLYDNPDNFIEVWIAFKDGYSAKARIGR